KFTNLVIENYNKAFVINQETVFNTPGFFRSQVYIDNCVIGGIPFGTNQRQVLGSKMQGGRIQLAFLNFAGDLSLDSTCVGVHYIVGPNPNGLGAFFDASDVGAN